MGHRGGHRREPGQYRRAGLRLARERDAIDSRAADERSCAHVRELRRDENVGGIAGPGHDRRRIPRLDRGSDAES